MSDIPEWICQNGAYMHFTCLQQLDMNPSFTGHIALSKVFLKCLPFQIHDIIIVTWVSSGRQIWVQYIFISFIEFVDVFTLIFLCIVQLILPPTFLYVLSRQNNTQLCLMFWATEFGSDLNTSSKVSFFISTHLLICLTCMNNKNKMKSQREVYFSNSRPNLGIEYLPAVGSTFIIKFTLIITCSTVL